MQRSRLTLAALIAFGCASVASYPIQTLAADPGSTDQAAPQGEDPPGPDNGATPAMPEHKGVIKPPPTGDQGIETDVPHPNAGHDEEVIPPPGTPGGDPNVEPR